jgi:capsular polysaccharide transport system permease protein
MNRLIHLSARTLKIALIAVPLLLYGLYLAFAAADRYVSESVITVRQAGGDAGASLPGAALLLAGVNPPAHEDTLHLRTFVHSQALALELDRQLGLRRHFGAVQADLPLRLPSDASQEAFVRYFRDRVEVGFDERASLLTIRAQGLDPAFAQRLNAAILESCDRFVNETSHRIARDRLQFAEGEFELASRRVQAAAGEVLAFQSRHKLLDPTAQAQASGALTMELQGARSRLEAELNGVRGFLQDNTFQVQTLKARIAALDRQIDTERQRATVDDRKGERLTRMAVEFQGLQMKADFAREAYKLAVASVENARIDATRKIKSLVVVEPPSRPQTAEYPRAAYNLAALLAICVLVYAITRLVLATIREHQD